MLTIPGDPATTAAISWRTDYADTISIGQIADAMAAPYPERDAKKGEWHTFSLGKREHSRNGPPCGFHRTET